jgi:hypothetical protein
MGRRRCGLHRGVELPALNAGEKRERWAEEEEGGGDGEPACSPAGSERQGGGRHGGERLLQGSSAMAADGDGSRRPWEGKAPARHGQKKGGRKGAVPATMVPSAMAGRGEEVEDLSSLLAARREQHREGGRFLRQEQRKKTAARERKKKKREWRLGKNGGVGVENDQVSTPIYRRRLGLGFSLVGLMGWAGMGLAQNPHSGRAKFIFPNKNVPADFVCVKTERAGVRTNERLSD